MIKNARIAVVGPPHSGKSVFLAHLFQYLQSQFPASTFFLQRACPDGEGNWSAESDQDLVQQIRSKGDFNREFMDFTLQSIENLSKQFDVVFVDCGGRITKENLQIISLCSHFILLSSNRQATEDWMNFCQGICGCGCLGVLDSTLDESKESYFNVDEKLGRLVHLDREFVPKQTIATIRKIANHVFKAQKTKVMKNE